MSYHQAECRPSTHIVMRVKHLLGQPESFMYYVHLRPRIMAVYAPADGPWSSVISVQRSRVRSGSEEDVSDNAQARIMCTVSG